MYSLFSFPILPVRCNFRKLVIIHVFLMQKGVCLDIQMESFGGFYYVNETVSDIDKTEIKVKKKKRLWIL